MGWEEGRTAWTGLGQNQMRCATRHTATDATERGARYGCKRAVRWTRGQSPSVSGNGLAPSFGCGPTSSYVLPLAHRITSYPAPPYLAARAHTPTHPAQRSEQSCITPHNSTRSHAIPRDPTRSHAIPHNPTHLLGDLLHSLYRTERGARRSKSCARCCRMILHR